MHKLVREVRFSIKPRLSEDKDEHGAFAGSTSNEMLAIYFELAVGLIGEVDRSTGFVINVLDIDRNVCENITPLFSERLSNSFRQGRRVGFSDIGKLLKLAAEKLADIFKPVILADLGLKLNPSRKVSIDCEDLKMIYLSEKFEFAATHKLWNDEFSKEKNFEVFGKCANPAGHGHNYAIEVTVKAPADEDKINVGDIGNVVGAEFLELVDHKNLNADVPQFSRHIPTVENIAVFAWEKLKGKFKGANLHCVTVFETDRTYCSYYG